MSVTQLLPTGLNYTVSWGGTKTTSNSTFNNYNPALSSNLAIAFSQPLLQNRGSYVNRLNLMIRPKPPEDQRIRLEGANAESGLHCRERLLGRGCGAREPASCRGSAKTSAAEFLKLPQKQLELGALSPLDIYNPQQTLATNEVERGAGEVPPGAA